MRLAEALASLEPRALEALAKKNDVKLELKTGARRSPIEQAVHSLSVPKALFKLDALSADVAQALFALVRAPQGLARAELGASLLKLVELGLVFREPHSTDMFSVPATYRIQVAPTATEDLRSLRVLLSRLDEETVRGIASHVVGATTGFSRVVLAGDVLSLLETEGRIAQELKDAPDKERGFFDALVARGGEIDVDEYSRITGELARPFTTSSAGYNFARRSLLFALARRGLAYVTPTDLIVASSEALRVVGHDPFGAAQSARQKLMERARLADLAPSRVRFGADPSAATVALFAAFASDGEVFKPNAGASRTALRRASKRADVSMEQGELLVALGRVTTFGTRSISVSGVSHVLCDAWRTSVAWDEARVEADALRAGDRIASLATPTRIVVHSVLALLSAVPKLRFVAREDLTEAVKRDLAVISAHKRFEKVVQREPERFVKSLDELIGRILDVSLVALGLVDAGQSDFGAVLRLSTSARAWLANEVSPQTAVVAAGASFAQHVLPIAADVFVTRALKLADIGNLFVLDGQLVVELSEESIARGVERGWDFDKALIALKSANLELSPPQHSQVEQAFSPRANARHVGGARVWKIDDPAAHAALLESANAATLLVALTPFPNLCVRDDASASAVQQWFASAGVRVMRE